MKVLVAISCVLAVASAGLIAPGGILLQAQHLPVIGPNGVPLEPPANVAARAQHAAAVAEAQARNGDIALIGSHYAYAAGPLALAAPQHLPVIGPNGVPLEPPANVAARAQHAAAVVEAQARNGDLALIASPLAYAGLAAAPLALSGIHGAAILAGPQHLPVIGPNGVPIEPLENQIARAQNAAAHLEAKARNGDLVHLGRKRRSLVTSAYLGPQHLPVIGPNGVPLEPAANVAARAQHAAAVAEAQARNGDGLLITGVPAALGYASPAALAYGIPAAHTYPALAPNGQPIETPEVQLAKAAHFAAHAEANARNGAAVLYAPGLAAITHNGVPLDTPEVAAARAAHLAAKAAALNGVYWN